jgi:hypothetical protein
MADWKEKLKNRTKQAAENKDARGTGRKSILDLSLLKLPLWTPRSGKDKNFIDIMPWRISQTWYKNLRTRSGDVTKLDVEDVDYKLEVARHSNVGPSKDHLLCLREAFGKSDPICEDMFAEYQKRKDGNKEFSAEKAKQLQPSWRCFYIVYDYDDQNKGFQLWGDVSYELFEKYLLDEMKIAIDEGGLVVPWDLLDGRSVEFKGREKKLGPNSFIEAEGIVFHKRDSYSEGVIDKLPSLDSALIILTYEQIRAVHYGLDHDGDEEIEQERIQEKEEKKTVPDQQVRTRSRGTEVTPLPQRVSTDAECPAGGKFGYDCNKIKVCKDEVCSQETYEACLKKCDELDKQSLAESPKMQEQSGGETRRRRGEASLPAEQPTATGGRTRRR